jgi:hypothetical protein|tara:strand:+ start:115 stop:303 length:189 start_codon:yes stop_codon:yes gene_type:complete
MNTYQNTQATKMNALEEQVYWLKKSGNTARKIMDRRLRIIQDLKIAKEYLEIQLNIEVSVDD